MAFVLVAGVAAGALAGASFLMVRQARYADSLDRAEREARSGLQLSAGADFGEGGVDPSGFASDYQANRGVPIVLLLGARRFPSDPRLDTPLPAHLAAVADRGELGFQRIDVGGDPYLVVAGPIPGSSARMAFLFSEQRLDGDLRQLRTVLLLGWIGVVVLAALVGNLLARRTLGPVARASDAARSMAEGLLHTRLPVEGEDEFGAWATSFNEMADALEGKITALSEAEARERRFTSDVSHELRTPLSALVGEASLLKEHLGRMPDESRRVAELLIRDVARLRRLVEELMEISRLDAGRENVRLEPVDVGALVGAVIRARGWDGRVIVSVAGRPALDTDPRRLERVVANLVGNAVEHGGGRAEVRLLGSSTDVRIEVEDRGPGISAKELPQIFERFYKADPARSGRGSGLGLAIAMENARLLGGDILVRSKPGSGSLFVLRIPVTQPLRPGGNEVTAPTDHEIHSRSEGGTT